MTRSTMPAVREEEMRQFWNERAQEDAFYFVDTRQRYRKPDQARFWEADELIEFILAELGVELRPSDRVLEIGCGIGRITRSLAAQTQEVVALDVSDEMLRQARELNPHLANVRWVRGDGVTLPGVESENIDACISVVVLQHVPDPEIALGYVRELGRVLRAGGWAALQISNDPSVHRPRDRLRHRAMAFVGLGPRGQRHPAWLGSHLELAAVAAAATDGGTALERVWGEGTQYCLVLLRKPAAR
jgi:SAM-dependent methyltransferase